MKKNKMFLSLVTLFLLILAIFLIWFTNLHVSEGYVYENEDSEVYVIDLEDSIANDMDAAELERELAVRASVESGNFVEIPFLNELIGTDFNKGDKVRIYWDGMLMPSAPGIIDGASLIVKLSK